MDSYPRGSDWMPITPKTGSLFHADLHETCKLNDVEPQAYITGVLDRLVNLWPASSIDELMPWAWAKASAPDRLAA